MKKLLLLFALTIVSLLSYSQQTNKPAGAVTISPQWFRVNSTDLNYIFIPGVNKYYNLTTKEYVDSKIGVEYTPGYGMSLVGQQFRVDTSLIVTKSFSNKYSEKSRFINIKDLGGLGDGTTNQTDLINSTILDNKEVYFPSGIYLVDSLVNKYGTQIRGPGKIVKQNTYDKQLLNITADYGQHVFGTEYLSSFHKALIAGNPVKAIWSGDSTTEGDATTTGFTIPQLMDFLNSQSGINGVTNLNRGHSGAASTLWFTNYLDSDLSELSGSGNLYTIRWGINDPAAGRTAIDVINTIDAGLKKIRSNSNYTYDKLSILLMNCSSTTETNFGLKSENYYEDLDKGFRLLARKYQCAYINTYGVFQDARRSYDYLDTPLPDTSFHVHPLNVQNTIIASKIFDVLIPQYYRQYTHNSNETKTNANGPSEYTKGVSIHLVNVSNGFPITGQLTTFQQLTAHLSYQILSSYESGNQIYMRGGFDGGWQPWKKIADDMGVIHTTGNETKDGDLGVTGGLFLGGDITSTSGLITLNNVSTINTAAGSSPVDVSEGSFLALQNLSLSSPDKRISLFGQLGTNSFFQSFRDGLVFLDQGSNVLAKLSNIDGSFSTVGVDNYIVDQAINFTGLSKINKAYADARYIGLADIDNFVTTNTAQSVTAIKTFDEGASFNSTGFNNAINASVTTGLNAINATSTSGSAIHGTSTTGAAGVFQSASTGSGSTLVINNTSTGNLATFGKSGTIKVTINNEGGVNSTSIASSGGISLAQKSVISDSDYAVLETDYTVLVQGGAINATITLPNSDAGKIYVIKRVNGGANTITISAAAIDGVTTKALTTDYSGYVLQSAGAGQYYIIGKF